MKTRRKGEELDGMGRDRVGCVITRHQEASCVGAGSCASPVMHGVGIGWSQAPIGLMDRIPVGWVVIGGTVAAPHAASEWVGWVVVAGPHAASSSSAGACSSASADNFIAIFTFPAERAASDASSKLADASAGSPACSGVGSGILV